MGLSSQPLPGQGCCAVLRGSLWALQASPDLTGMCLTLGEVSVCLSVCPCPQLCCSLQSCPSCHPPSLQGSTARQLLLLLLPCLARLLWLEDGNVPSSGAAVLKSHFPTKQPSQRGFGRPGCCCGPSHHPRSRSRLCEEPGVFAAVSAQGLKLSAR